MDFSAWAKCRISSFIAYYLCMYLPKLLFDWDGQRVRSALDKVELYNQLKVHLALVRVAHPSKSNIVVHFGF